MSGARFAAKLHHYLLTCACAPFAAPQDANAFTCIVVTDTGKFYGKFLGLVTSREVDFEADHLKTLDQVMTKWVAVRSPTAGELAAPAHGLCGACLLAAPLCVVAAGRLEFCGSALLGCAACALPTG